LEAGDLRLR